MSAVLYIIIWYYYINHISNVIFFNKRSSIKMIKKKLPQVENQLIEKNIENKYIFPKKKRVFKLSHFTNSLALFFTRTMLINL